MKRELASKMYSPSAYFLGRLFSNILINLLYPWIIIVTLFWLVGLETSMQNLGWFFLFGSISNFVFCGQGYFLGIVFLDESSSRLMNFMFIMVFVCSNGVLCNLTTANWFVVALSHISPIRFNCEGFIRIMSA